MTTEIQIHLKSASDSAKQWFEEQTVKVSKEKLSRSKMGDTGKGTVYVYFNSDKSALYVGQTSRHVKARLYDQTSPHKKKDWWGYFEHIRFVQMQDPIDRLVLEFLLILAYSPTENRNPQSKKIEELFSNFVVNSE